MMTDNRIRGRSCRSERKEQAIQLHREGFSHREKVFIADTRESNVDALVSEITKRVIASLIQVLSESVQG